MMDAARVTCCQTMQAQLDVTCPDHYDDMSQCPDGLVTLLPSGEYALPVHDGGSTIALIDYCPWCGSRLTRPWQAIKRRWWRWFP
jgi:hypothetical protein